MKQLQIFRLISICTALLVGFWLPFHLIGTNVSPLADQIIDLWISAVSILNLRMHFEKRDLDWRKPSNWISIPVLMDLICLVPWTLVDAVAPNPQIPWIMIHILNTRHVWKIKEFLDEFDSLQPVVYRLVPLAFTMPLLVHLISCGWIALGSGTAGPDPDKNLEYIKAVYWAFTTLTTVGYGDISAKTPPQMLFAAMTQVLGVGVFGFVLSNVASLLSRIDAAREHHMDSLDKIETYMRNHHIPAEMKSKVRSYYHFVWTQHKGYSDKTLLEDLPMKMKSEMFLHINKRIIEKVPLFKGASAELLEDLMNELTSKIFVPEERIFRTGDPGDSMYFIQSGAVEILTADGKPIATLSEGAFFGEMALIFDNTRSATARSKSYCDVYCLSKESFQRVLKAYPEFGHHIEEVIRERQAAQP